MRNFILAASLSFLTISVLADESKDMSESLEARNRVINALSIATGDERCKNVIRMVLQEVDHQDREVAQHIQSNKHETYFWQHARYAYESSYNHMRNSNCTLGNK